MAFLPNSTSIQRRQPPVGVGQIPAGRLTPHPGLERATGMPGRSQAGLGRKINLFLQFRDGYQYTGEGARVVLTW